MRTTGSRVSNRMLPGPVTFRISFHRIQHRVVIRVVDIHDAVWLSGSAQLHIAVVAQPTVWHQAVIDAAFHVIVRPQNDRSCSAGIHFQTVVVGFARDVARRILRRHVEIMFRICQRRRCPRPVTVRIGIHRSDWRFAVRAIDFHQAVFLSRTAQFWRGVA